MRKIFAIFFLMLTSAASDAPSKDKVMHHAAGEFEVKMKPVSAADEPVMRMSLDKKFHGDLVAESVGQMMAGGNEANSARVYVALETVTGSLENKTGSFVLAHRGTMTRDAQALSVIIVPETAPTNWPASRAKWASTSATENISTRWITRCPNDAPPRYNSALCSR